MVSRHMLLNWIFYYLTEPIIMDSVHQDCRFGDAVGVSLKLQGSKVARVAPPNGM